MRFSEAVTQFEIHLKALGRSPHTVASYLGDTRLLSAWLSADGQDDPGVETIRTEQLAAFMASAQVQRLADGTPKAPGSINKVCASVRAFFRYLIEIGRLDRDPARPLRRRPAPAPPPAILTHADEKALHKTVRSRTGTMAERDRLMLELLVGTGIRLSSLVGLDVEDVRLDEKRIIIRAKGGAREPVFIRTELRRLLRIRLRDMARAGIVTGPLFRSSRGTRISKRQVQMRLAHWLAEADIEKPVTVHGLRHTFGTNLYARTHDLRLVQRALGHKQVTTTQIYTQLADDAIEEAVEGM